MDKILKNKKGVMKLLFVMIFFSFALLLVFFMTLFIQDIGKTEILDRLDNYSLMVEDDLGVSEQMKTHIHEFPEEYEALTIPYDLYFVLSFLIVFISTILSSIKAREQTIYEFFGIITIGIIVVLFVTSFIDIINSWFILNMINGFLEISLENYPIFNYYISNIAIINMIWAFILIVVNKINIKPREEEPSLEGLFDK